MLPVDRLFLVTVLLMYQGDGHDPVLELNPRFAIEMFGSVRNSEGISALGMVECAWEQRAGQLPGLLSML